MFPTPRIILHADAGPVVEGIAEPKVATIPYQHNCSLPALSCYGRHAGVGSKPMIISFRDELRSFGEERGGYYASYAWQREEHLHVRGRFDSSMTHHPFSRNKVAVVYPIHFFVSIETLPRNTPRVSLVSDAQLLANEPDLFDSLHHLVRVLA